jgi:hypothetical protein
MKPTFTSRFNCGPEEKEGTTTIAEAPFCINFSYSGKSVRISLIKGEDVFKLAELFKNMLGKYEIEYNIEISENK